MRRIQDPTAVITRPATPTLSGVTGYFTNGTPGSVAPTIVPDWWLNMTQEELIGLLVAVGLPLDGSATVLQAINQLISSATNQVKAGRLLAVRYFTTSQAYVPTPGTGSIEIELLGGGGGGGGAVTPGSGQVSAGSGGGAGGYCRKFIASGFAGSQITIGNYGAAQMGGGGFAGGATSFGSFATATGGSGGSQGPASVANNVPFGGAVGGMGYGGDLNAAGGIGKYALYSSPATSGEGGSSVLGSGGSYNTGSATGISAINTFGAGGGGGVQSIQGGGSAAGGNGATGIAIIKEYTA